MYQHVRKCVCNDISHVSMRKRDKNSPRTSTCDDLLASTIAISGVRCYTVMRSFVKIKSSQNGEITLSTTDIVKSCSRRDFLCRKYVF